MVEVSVVATDIRTQQSCIRAAQTYSGATEEHHKSTRGMIEAIPNTFKFIKCLSTTPRALRIDCPEKS